MAQDRRVVMEAVKQNVYALQFASEELKQDREFIHEAIKQILPKISSNTNELLGLCTEPNQELILTNLGGRAITISSSSTLNDVFEKLKADNESSEFLLIKEQIQIISTKNGNLFHVRPFDDVVVLKNLRYSCDWTKKI